MIIIRGALAVTMDERLGDLQRSDVVIDGDRIEAIGPSGAHRVAHADIVDGRGKIAIPGLVNAHMHTWQTAASKRRVELDAARVLQEDARRARDGVPPEDLYIATLVGALNQINCGTTTLVDWCHNNPTPAHNDAGIDASRSRASAPRSFTAHPSRIPSPASPGSGRSRIHARNWSGCKSTESAAW